MATYYRPSGTSEFWSALPTFTRTGTSGTDGGGAYYLNLNYVNGVYRRYLTASAKVYGSTATWTPSNGNTVYSGTSTSHTIQQITAFTLTTAAGTGGSASGGGVYLDGASATIVAIPAEHYRFVKWQDDNTSASRSITVSANATYTATFERSEYLVTVASTGGHARATLNGTANGSVYVGTAGSCAIAAPGVNGSDGMFHARFIQWSDTVATNSRTYTPTQDVTLTAQFAAKYAYAATADATKGTGYVVNASNLTWKYYASGDTVEFYGRPNSGYSFLHWKNSSGDIVSTAQSYPVTFGSVDLTLTAHFTANAQPITVTADDSDWGSAKIVVGGVDRGDAFSVPHGTTAVLTASVATNGMFLGWQLGGTVVGNELTLSVVAAGYTLAAYTALFAEAESYVITLTAGDGDPGTTGGSDLANAAGNAATVLTAAVPDTSPAEWYGGFVEMQALAVSGWHLSAWVGTPAVGVEGAFTISETDEGFSSMLRRFIDRDIAIEAVFVVNKYTVTAAVDAASATHGDVEVKWDTASGGDFAEDMPEAGVAYGNYAQLTATPDGTDEFRGWFRDDVLIQSEAVLVVQVDGNLSYVAKFGSYVSASADGTGTGKVYAPGSTTPVAYYNFTYGETVRIKATAGVDNSFEAWFDLADALFETPLFQYGADHYFVPEGITELVAKFGATAVPVVVKMTNADAIGGGELLLSSADGGLVEISEDDYIDELYDYFGGVNPLELSDPTRDRFFKLDSARMVTASVLLLSPNTLFSKWRIAYNTSATAVGTPADLTTDAVATFHAAAPCVLTPIYESSAPVKTTLRYVTGQDTAFGTVELSPAGDNATTGNIVQGDFAPRAVVEASAFPANGYKFVGWWPNVEASGSATYTTAVVSLVVEAGPPITLYAKFALDTDAVYLWEGSESTKTLAWRSRRYVGTEPFNPSSIRVSADGYPVVATVRMASSADADESQWRKTTVVLESQDPRRLPKMRPEKHMELELLCAHGIAEAAIGTSMSGLRQ